MKSYYKKKVIFFTVLTDYKTKKVVNSVYEFCKNCGYRTNDSCLGYMGGARRGCELLEIFNDCHFAFTNSKEN